MPQVAMYGSWRSPIDTGALTSAARAFGALGATTEALWWCEARPDEGGRTALFERRGNGPAQCVLPAPWNARSRVHEYGGAAVVALPDGYAFVQFSDQQIYRVATGGAPQQLTTERGVRFAEPQFDARRNRLIAIAERHRQDDAGEPENLIVAIDLTTGVVSDLLRGADFYAAPRLDPRADRLAFLRWSHPNMPWDAAQLLVVALGPEGEAGPAVSLTRVAGESAFQPEWLPDGTLVYMCDRHGYWNPWHWGGDIARPVLQENAEYGLPLWGLGTRSYCVVDADTLVAQRLDHGVASLVRIDVRTGRLDVLPTEWQRFGQPIVAAGRVLFIGERPDRAAALVAHDLQTHSEVVLEGGSSPVDAGYLSTPERIAFTGDRGETSYAWFYAPRNRDFAGDGPPPLMVMSHGGPTGATSPSLNLRIQYFTSRGFAVVDVDYAGSTGYGRAYRDRLQGRWGIADVADVVAAVDHLVAAGQVDVDRVAIRGGSAGGYTTLAALAFTTRFRAGVSLYGIGDLAALARDTHKFEARYTDWLVAPWPEGEAIYQARSPIHHLDGLRCPAIFLQGALDKVVPPNQAETMAAALRSRGVPVAHIVFADEGHGFRSGSNVRRAMDLEYTFLARVFGFVPADPLTPLQIDNLPEETA